MTPEAQDSLTIYFSLKGELSSLFLPGRLWSDAALEPLHNCETVPRSGPARAGRHRAALWADRKALIEPEMRVSWRGRVKWPVTAITSGRKKSRARLQRGPLCSLSPGRPIVTPLRDAGVRAIDTFMTVKAGQRRGLPDGHLIIKLDDLARASERVIFIFVQCK